MAESFLVYGEDGRELRVTVIRSRIDASTFDGPASIEGPRELRLQDGTPVNYVDEHTCKNALTGEVLKRKR